MAGRPWIRRTTLSAIIGLGALMAAGVSAVATPTDPTPGPLRPEIIDPQVRTEAAAAARAGGQVEYLVALDATAELEPVKFDREAVVGALHERAERSQAPVVELLRGQGQEVLNTFWLANLVLARSSAESMTALTALPGVDAILPVGEVEVLEPAVEPVGLVSPQVVGDRTWGIDRIGANRVWDDLGVDGSGVRVAVLDTGVDVTHPDLAGAMVTTDPGNPAFPGGWMEFDPAGRPVPSGPHDTQWHGTHVSGTVLGGDNFQAGTAIGAAPGAQLLHALVLPGGSGSIPQVIAGMQWAVAPFDQAGSPVGEPADVVNMSFGPQAGGIADELVEPIRNMYFAGVLPVASSGNCGDGCHGSPGNVHESLGVGATDIADDVADFSSGGMVHSNDWANPPSDWPESWIVPDVSAPGVDVISSVPPGTFPEDPTAIYGSASGTSMASPHTAATAALMLSGDPDLGVGHLAGILTGTSFFDDRHGGERPNGRFGHGRVDAHQAVAQVVLHSGVAGQVTDAGSRAPVAGARVEVAELGWATTTDTDGRYQLRLHPGEYTLVFSAFGYEGTTAPGTDVDEGRVTTVDAALVPMPTGSIRGTVTLAESGHGVPGVEVDLPGTPVPAVTTGSDGAYTIHRVPPGTYPVVASPGTLRAPRAQEVTVTPGSPATVDFLLECPECLAQQRWVARHGAAPGDGFNRPMALGVSPDGSAVYVAGDSAGAGGSADYATVAHDAATGAQLWATGYDGPGTGSDTPGALGVSPDGQLVYVTGGSGGEDTGLDYATVAYHAATGDELWVARYDGPGNDLDIATDLAVNPEGSTVYVTGRSRSGATLDSEDYATVAYDARTGEELWLARYSATGEEHDGAWAMDISPDGATVYVTGQSRSGADFASIGYATVAYDAATGEQRWVARHHEGAIAVARALAVSRDGAAVYVTGDSHASAAGSDYVTVAYDGATGAEVWVAHQEPAADEFAVPSAVAVDPGGDTVFVTGHRRLGFPVLAATDYATVAYQAETGEEQWLARYPATEAPLGTTPGLGVSPDGAAVYLAGQRRFEPGASVSRATVAYRAATGEERWVGRYDGVSPGAEQAQGMGVSPDGSAVYVTGASPREAAGTDFATLAYQADAGDEFTTFVPWDLRIEPNPVLREVAATITVSVTNVGTAGGDYEATLTVGGELVDTAAITLGPGHTRELEWPVTRDGLGGHDVWVAHLAGKLQVVEASFGYLRERVEAHQQDGQVTRAGEARLLAALRQAEHHLGRGNVVRGGASLESFAAVADDTRFVPGEAARQELTIGAGELIAAVELASPRVAAWDADGNRIEHEITRT